MKTKSSKVWILIVGAITVIAIVAFFVINSMNNKEKAGTPGDTTEITISVDAGEGVASIARKLKEKGIISNERLFRKHVQKLGKDSQFKYGDFIVTKAMSYDELSVVFTTEPQGNRFTVVEGRNLMEIGRMVEERGLGTLQEFLTLVNAAHGYTFEDYLEPNNLVLFAHEGFVFPDTYHVNNETTLEMLVDLMLQNFDNKFTDKHYARMDELGLSLRETIALASIIQEEAGVEEEMKKVSAVFHNRLQEGSGLTKLQSDVTVFYAQTVVGEHSNNNTAMMEAYDTYDSDGISVGPITNPGMMAIEAALNPADVAYLYFLTDNEGTYYYANTFEEHERYLTQAEEVNKRVAANS